MIKNIFFAKYGIVGVGSGSQFFFPWTLDQEPMKKDPSAILHIVPEDTVRFFCFMLLTAVFPSAVTVVGVGTETTVVAGPDTEQVWGSDIC